MEDDWSILGSFIALIAVGTLLLAVNALAPMDSKAKTIVSVLVAVLVVLLLPSVFGDFSLSENIQLAR